MNHENLPHDPERHEQHPHVSKQPGQECSKPSTSSERNKESTFTPEGEPSYYPPDKQTFPGITELPNITEWRFEGPTPSPHIIEWHNRIKPGSGDRIMDDAHEDMRLDREITKATFDYTIHESKVRLYTAVGLCIATVALVPIVLMLFEPPESIAGSSIVGAVGLSPLVSILLNNRRNDASNPLENGRSNST